LSFIIFLIKQDNKNLRQKLKYQILLSLIVFSGNLKDMFTAFLTPLNLPIFDALRSAAPALFVGVPGRPPRVPLQLSMWPNNGNPPPYNNDGPPTYGQSQAGPDSIATREYTSWYGRDNPPSYDLATRNTRL
jgi:hypothetical protein